MMNVLAIESSCDETAVAVVACKQGAGPDRVTVIASVISSQIELHRQHGGVVPEVASRDHCRRLLGVVEVCLQRAGVELSAIDAFAATMGPGLASSLLVGSTFAKGLALGTGKPFYGINHLEGHLLSPFIASQEGENVPFVPHLALIVSGGHTLLLDCAEVGNYQLIGKSRDDAAGEAFDKVGKMLGLPYPGGPEIEKLARRGDSQRFDFPRSMMGRGERDFSFSGLKTAVLYTLRDLGYAPGSGENSNSCLNSRLLADLCASFQAAVVEVLVRKSVRVARELGHSLIAVSGGVSCNRALRDAFVAEVSKYRLRVVFPLAELSTDNAAMIGYAGLLRLQRGAGDSLGQDIDPNLPLTVGGNRAKASKQ